jgi:FkbM family methyltransferase
MVKLLLRVLNRTGLLNHLNLTLFCKVNGTDFKIPLMGHTGFDIFFEKESWMGSMVKRLLDIRPYDAFVDVGVNLGQTMLTVKSINKDIPYFGFEPNPVCVTFLTRLIKINEISCEIFPVALSDHTGFAVLFKDKTLAEDSSATIVENFRDTIDRDQVHVPVSSERPAILEKSKVGIIKIDVEGAEMEVIKCLYSLIKNNRPFIICEILPVYEAQNHFRFERQETLIKMLKDIDYVIFRIHANSSVERLGDIGIHGNVKDSNYLFVPSEFRANIQ